MPHGKISLLPAMILTMSFVSSMITLIIPNFALPGGIVDDYRPYYGVGIWGGSAFYPPTSTDEVPSDCPEEPTYDDDDDMVDDKQVAFGPCFPEHGMYWVGYDDHHFDDPYRKAAMSFALIASIFGLGAMAGLWPITCCRYGRCAKCAIICLVVVSFISQLLTFLIFGTNYCKEVEGGCTIGPGGATSLSAAFGWLLGAFSIALIPDPTPNATAAVETCEASNIKVVETAIEAVPIRNEEKV